MFLRIENIPEKKLVGKSMKMSLSENKTAELWRSFMIDRKTIKNNISDELISMQVYEPAFHITEFNQETVFKKWAVVEVTDFNSIPPGMKSFNLTGGLYAVFLHKGAASTGPEIFRFIYGTWLPTSVYEFDNRPQFEVLGEKYKNNEPDSEEEIWIPVKLKQ